MVEANKDEDVYTSAATIATGGTELMMPPNLLQFAAGNFKASTLDKLPMDVVSTIFSHLDLVELIGKVSQLSHKWN